MKTMSQVASIAECPETMEEARGIIAHQHDLITTLRSSDREKTIAALKAALARIEHKWTTESEACSDHTDLAFEMAQIARTAQGKETQA